MHADLQEQPVCPEQQVWRPGTESPQALRPRPEWEDVWILDNMEIMLMYLLDDGILEPTGQVENIKEGALSKKQYRLTARGRDSIGRWFPPEKSVPRGRSGESEGSRHV